MGANTGELVHCRQPAQKHIVTDNAVAAQCRAVGEYDIIADPTIVADMTVGHVEATLPDLRYSTTRFAATVHGDAFADVAVSTDIQTRRSAPVAS